jgi:hypothetical protein
LGSSSVARRVYRCAWVVVGGLVVFSAIGLLELRHNQSLSKNALAAIVQVRVLPNPPWREWFVAHGMPYSRPVARLAGAPFQVTERSTEPVFLGWLDRHGESTYLRFVLSHPRYTLLGPLPYFSGERASLHEPNLSPFFPLQPNPTPSMLSPDVNYGRHREVVPSFVAGVLFNQGQFGDVLTLAILALGAMVAAVRRLGRDPRLTLPLVIAALAVPEGYILWLSGGEATGELDRLSMVTAVSVRIGLWILLAVGLDRLLAARGAAAAKLQEH